jgi:hypothetical protein
VDIYAVLLQSPDYNPGGPVFLETQFRVLVEIVTNGDEFRQIGFDGFFHKVRDSRATPKLTAKAGCS